MSSEVKRYNPDVFGDMRENPAGEYVRSLDFDKVAADLQEFKNGNTMALLRAGFAKACDERDALRAELAEVKASGWRNHSVHYARAEKCPQTLETAQAAWDRDQELIEEQRAEINRHKQTINQLRQRRPAPMTTLPYDVSRCSGRFDLRTDGEWCHERDTCKRYLAFSQWDRSAGVTDYQPISVTMGRPDCGMKIEVTP